MSRKPKTFANPSPKSQPRVAAAPDHFFDLSPAWRVARLELMDPYGWHEIERSTILKIRERLASFETMRWREILVDAGTSHHMVSVSRLSKAARDRLDLITRGQVNDDLLSLRLTGRERIWGIFDRGVCQLLWWDPDHQVCPSLLKHT